MFSYCIIVENILNLKWNIYAFEAENLQKSKNSVATFGD